jgi:SAM-dependent methyltransferase
MRAGERDPQSINVDNSRFWNDICGTEWARSVGLTSLSPDNLRRFDQAYLDYYPYLKKYVAKENLAGMRVLELGLGYGTLGQLLVEAQCDYFGVDIAFNPVAMMRYRLYLLGKEPYRVQVSSAHDLPFRNEEFSFVYTIGCLHHTGDLERAVSEIYRVLKTGGRAVIMVYNSHSFRRWVRIPMKYAAGMLKGLLVGEKPSKFSAYSRGLYDSNPDGTESPFTEFVSKRRVKRIFGRFSSVHIQCENFDSISIRGKTILPRKWFLNNVGRLVGLDLYVLAAK